MPMFVMSTRGSCTVLSRVSSVCMFPLYKPITLSCFEFHPEISLCAMRKLRGTLMCAILPQTICTGVFLHILLIVILFYFTAGCQEKSSGSLGSNVLSDRQTRPAVLLQTVLCDLKWI